MRTLVPYFVVPVRFDHIGVDSLFFETCQIAFRMFGFEIGRDLQGVGHGRGEG